MVMIRVCVLLIVLAALPVPTTAAGREPSLGAVFTEAGEVFTNLRKTVKQVVIEPAERDQALRYLRRLSYRLAVLAQEKDNFAIEMINAKWPGDQRTILAQAHDLTDSLWKVKRSLIETFDSLPDTFRRQGGKIQESLNLGLNSKLESLEKVAEFVGAPTVSRKVLLEK